MHLSKSEIVWAILGIWGVLFVLFSLWRSYRRNVAEEMRIRERITMLLGVKKE